MKECSIFVFEKRTAEKLHKPKRKDMVTEILRASVKQLERFRHPKILQIMHTVEESSETLSFATEPVIASLANVLAYQHCLPFSTGATESQQRGIAEGTVKLDRKMYPLGKNVPENPSLKKQNNTPESQRNPGKEN
ncbi:conserved hypothetical protein [Culex quinquefasciatus]|uniref:Uncharacterized protein n=1 Tax=Culex quinquefasciatus TaxID=7176 RepID=B0WH84_CULQU|nr:conserved hypothetical protein [Culex quinquefasciatus]|eukprot:XP_001848049.1 conserved hypothetical protein [Culex quinquefasciatus]